MKALYTINDEAGKLQGNAAGVLKQLDELSNQEGFVGHKLFATTNEMSAVADFDETSDLLSNFAIILDDEQKLTANEAAGVTTITYVPVTEDKSMNFNFHRGLQTTEGLGGQSAEEALDTPDLFDEVEDGVVTYEGAAGTHNAEGPLDLPSINYAAPFAGQQSEESLQKNSQTARAARSGGEETALDLPEMQW